MVKLTSQVSYKPRRSITSTRAFLIILVVAAAAIGVAYYQMMPPKDLSDTVGDEDVMQFSLMSSGFKYGDIIPTKYTCDGEDASPPLSWDDPPEGTRSLALIMDDPDAPIGVFTHWVLFNLPKDTAGLPEKLPKQGTLEGGGIQGRNDFGRLGYGGPCPPPGPPHTYRFRLYAVDVELSLEAGASKEDVLEAIQGHILAEAELTGRYGR